MARFEISPEIHTAGKLVSSTRFTLRLNSVTLSIFASVLLFIMFLFFKNYS